ncbi:MAG: glycosyltransferase family 2 protein [Maricaulaceae bacterium]
MNAPPPSDRPTLSVVAPAFNEAGNVEALVLETAAALEGWAFEILIVDDASTDATPQALRALKARVPQLRVLCHGRNAGQSRAIRTGAEAARGGLLATLDGDGQNDPADLPRLVSEMMTAAPEAALGMVSGQRVKRRDPWWKRAASRAGNALRRAVLRDGASDTGCGIKVMRRDAFLALPYFDHMHRFLPALFQRDGWAVIYCDVNHRARATGRSKYTNIGRLAASVVDLTGVVWLIARARRHDGVREL